MVRLLVSAGFDPPQHEEQSTDSGQCICRQIPYSTGPSLPRMAARSGLKHSGDYLALTVWSITHPWEVKNGQCVCSLRERETKNGVLDKNSHWQPHWLSTYRHADRTQQRNKHWANVHFVICAKLCVCVFVLIYCLKASQHKQIITCILLIALKSEQEKNNLNFQQTDTLKRPI